MNEVGRMPLEGLQLDRYDLLRRIGGNTGEVYLAEDTRIKRRVAIKINRSEEAVRPDAETIQGADLFRQEMEVVAMFDHPHILPLFDYGERLINGETLTYMVMPFCPEGSLAKWLQRRGSEPLSLEDIGHIIRQAADALQHAHDHHIIHRDIKPPNFLIRSSDDPNRPTVLLADFGIATLYTTTTNTNKGFRGTPHYTAPEQWASHAVPASDQYALAIMAYELMTGRVPFQGDLPRLMYQHLNVQPEPPGKYNTNIPRAIDAIILRALAKKPEDRFPSISTFAQAFWGALQRGNDIHVTLAINENETLSKSKHTLPLPGGRRVTVTVPAGTQDGQIFSLDGQGEPSPYGGDAGRLIVTVVLRSSSGGNQAIGAPLQGSANAQVNPGTSQIAITSSEQLIVESDVNTRAPVLTHTSVPTATIPASKPISKQLLQHFRGRNILLIGLALLIVASGLGLFYIARTARVAITEGLAAASASAATATFVAENPDPYPPNTGKLVLYDRLNQRALWDNRTDSASGGACQFIDQAYHVSQSMQANPFLCTPSATRVPDFSNFAFEVQMEIIAGDCGGIAFRGNSANGQYYFFRVCQNSLYTFQNSQYTLLLYTGNTEDNAQILRENFLPTINTDLNQSNLIAVVANGRTLDLYVNRQRIASISDSTYSHGQIGLAALSQSGENPTEVVYSNAKVWQM